MSAALSALALWVLVMAGVTLLFWGLSPRLLRRYRAGTLSALWLLIAVAWLLPVRPAGPWGGAVTTLGAQLPQQQVGDLSASFSLWEVTVGALAVGVVAALTRLGIQYRRFFAHVRRWGSECVDPQILAAVRRNSHDLGLKKEVAVFEVPGIQTPMVFGVREAKLLVPAQGQVPDELVIRHELAHIRRRDPQIRLLLGMIQAFQWWNPFIHLIAKNLRASSEMACDQMALRGVPVGERHDYARRLLCAATATNPNILVVAFGQKGAYRSRLGVILDSSGRRGGALLVVPLILAFGFVGVPVALQPNSVLNQGGTTFTGPLPPSTPSLLTDNLGEDFTTVRPGGSLGSASELVAEPLVESADASAFVSSGSGAGRGVRGSNDGQNGTAAWTHHVEVAVESPPHAGKGWAFGTGNATGQRSFTPQHSH